MTNKTLLSVIVPAHNEEQLIEKTITSINKSLKDNKIDHEIVIVENGSHDKTLELCRGLKDKIPEVSIISLETGNYGEALKKGILSSKGDILTIINVDFWDLKFIQDSRNLTISEQADLVVGSKHLYPNGDDRGLVKRTFSQSFNLLLRFLFGFKGTDTHGLKTLIKKKIVPIVKSSATSDFVFDTELVLRSYSEGLKVKELPVKVKEIRPRRYNNFGQIFKTLSNVAKLYWEIKVKKGKHN